MDRQRGRPSRVDKARVERLHLEGWSYRQIARDQKCSESYISHLLNPQQRTKRLASLKAHKTRKRKEALLLKVEDYMRQNKPLSGSMIQKIGAFSLGDAEFTRKVNRLLHG